MRISTTFECSILGAIACVSRVQIEHEMAHWKVGGVKNMLEELFLLD